MGRNKRTTRKTLPLLLAYKPTTHDAGSIAAISGQSDQRTERRVYIFAYWVHFIDFHRSRQRRRRLGVRFAFDISPLQQRGALVQCQDLPCVQWLYT